MYFASVVNSLFMRLQLPLFVCILISTLSYGQEKKDILLSTLQEELAREMTALEKANQPPYYLDYRVTDTNIISIGASSGSLVRSSHDRNRYLVTRIRIGSRQFDNTHPINGNRMNEGWGVSLPLDDEPDALHYALWRATENEYRRVIENYKSAQASKSEEKTKTPEDDFSQEQPNTYYEEPTVLPSVDKTLWEKKMKDFSSYFIFDTDLIRSDLSLQIIHERKYFVSSEGSSQVQNSSFVYINISSSIRSDDGDMIPLHRSFFAPSLEQLPKDEVIIDEIKSMLIVLKGLKTAPLANPYSGPAILDARAAGVFFHEIFGHRLEGHRLKSEQDGQTFKTKVGQSVLPSVFNVYFDPTVNRFENHHLNGSYRYDDEGVKAQRVSVVEKGILKTFLMSRAPLLSFSKSNGHGRAAYGSSPVSRQSNLFVETIKPRTSSDLRQMLIKECKKQGKEYGYLFKDVIGGFTLTGRMIPNAFNIFPTEVYRVYTNGKPDELVRGVDLIGTPLAMFAEISAADNNRGVFTGFCGAESGFVPVSAVAPSLFVRRIETQKKPKSTIENPLLPPPASNRNTNNN